VYESKFPRAKKTHWTKWKKEYQVIEMYQPMPFTHEQLNYIVSFLGHKYSVLQVIIQGLGIIYSPFDKLFRQKSINGSKFLVCTEYVGLYLMKYKGFTWSDSPDHISLTELRGALIKRYRRIPWLS
jgi:hypothetical protein